MFKLSSILMDTASRCRQNGWLRWSKWCHSSSSRSFTTMFTNF